MNIHKDPIVREFSPKVNASPWGRTKRKSLVSTVSITNSRVSGKKAKSCQIYLAALWI